MKFVLKSPAKAINTLVKQIPNRTEINNFKNNLIELLDKLKEINNLPKEVREEHFKNNINFFLRDIFIKIQML
jgi:hypothetical protein